MSIEKLISISGLWGAACLGSATMLTFDNYATVPILTTYGSRVNASGFDANGLGGFNLNDGATPNVQTSIFEADPTSGASLGLLNTWGASYGSLLNVAYHSATKSAKFIFTADPGFNVSLLGFKMGGWPQAAQSLPFLQIKVDGNTVVNQTNVAISGTPYTEFNFNSLTGSTIELWYGNNWNVGIDDVRFAQATVVPEPATLAVLAASVLFVRRRTR